MSGARLQAPPVLGAVRQIGSSPEEVPPAVSGQHPELRAKNQGGGRGTVFGILETHVMFSPGAGATSFRASALLSFLMTSVHFAGINTASFRSSKIPTCTPRLGRVFKPGVHDVDPAFFHEHSREKSPEDMARERNLRDIRAHLDPIVAKAALHDDHGSYLTFKPSILLAAVQISDVAAIATLVSDHHLDVNEDVDGWGRTPAHFAARWGCTDSLQALCLHGATLVSTGKNRDTPAHEAANAGHASCLAVLRTQGCSFEHGDKHGYTPAYIAACFGHEECLQVILGSGIDAACLHGGDCAQITALEVAEKNGHSGCAAMINEYNLGSTRRSASRSSCSKQWKQTRSAHMSSLGVPWDSRRMALPTRTGAWTHGTPNEGETHSVPEKTQVITVENDAAEWDNRWSNGPYGVRQCLPGLPAARFRKTAAQLSRQEDRAKRQFQLLHDQPQAERTVSHSPTRVPAAEAKRNAPGRLKVMGRLGHYAQSCERNAEASKVSGSKVGAPTPPPAADVIFFHHLASGADVWMPPLLGSDSPVSGPASKINVSKLLS